MDLDGQFVCIVKEVKILIMISRAGTRTGV